MGNNIKHLISNGGGLAGGGLAGGGLAGGGLAGGRHRFPVDIPKRAGINFTLKVSFSPYKW